MGTFLRNSLSITRQNYLDRFSELSYSLLGQAQPFSDYPHSVWKAFQISFSELLKKEDEPWPSARSMAYFIASLEDSSTLNDCIKICHRASCSNRLRAHSGSNMVDILSFLENKDKLLMSFQALASVDLIISDPSDDRSKQLPSIEMHSLIRNWLRSKSRIQPYEYVSTRLWLLGFVIYDDLLQTRVSSGRYDLLVSELLQRVRELKFTHDNGLSQLCNLEISFPFLVQVLDRCETSLNYLQPESELYQKQLQAVSDKLISEMYDDFVNGSWHMDWNMFFDGFIGEAEQQVRLALQDYGRGQSFDLIGFFTKVLDENECLPIAFNMIASEELQSLIHVTLIEDIKQQVIYKLRQLTLDHVHKEAFHQAKDIFRGSTDEARNRIFNWRELWTKDVVAIIREGFSQVILRLSSELPLQTFGMELQSSSKTSLNNATTGSNALRVRNHCWKCRSDKRIFRNASSVSLASYTKLSRCLDSS